MNPIPKQPADLITPERIQQAIRMRFNPIPSLTPQLLASYLDAFRLGFFRNAVLAWDAMERRDYTLQTVAPKRRKAVARLGWEIVTRDDSPAALAQKAALQFFYDNLTATNALEENETGGLALLVRQMMDAIGKRYAVHEIIWEPRSKLIVDSQRVDGQKASGVPTQSSINSSAISQSRDPSRDVNFSSSQIPQPSLTATFRCCPLWWFEGTQGRLRFLTTEFAIYGVDLESGGWLVTVGDGLMEACSVAYMFKQLPLRDWLNFSEKFGMPGIVGRTDAALDSPEWKQLVEAVKNFSQDWSAVFSRNNSLELIEPKPFHGEGPFAPLVEKMDRAITTLWRGGDLGTLSSRNATGASLQEDESDILLADDAQLIGETLNTQVSRRVLQYHFGDAPQIAWLKLRAADAQDLDHALKVDQFLLEAGAPLAVKDTLARYDRPMPKQGETLLKPLPDLQTALNHSNQ